MGTKGEQLRLTMSSRQPPDSPSQHDEHIALTFRWWRVSMLFV
jgi:hypothetical protein